MKVSLPIPLLESLRGVKGFDEPAFVEVHESGRQVVSIRFNPFKNAAHVSPAPVFASVPWASEGVFLTERPSFTADPLLHAGAYYVQEASSMFLEQALLQTVNMSGALRVLDLCAAPGGKSTHIQSLINENSLLVSNEIIKQRVNVLNENLVKWGGANTIVTNNDPAHFARLEGYFDVMMVDAPCSGSGLFRRDENAIEEWSPNNVALCSQRQQRILADAWPALKEGGILIYSTCSYSRQENEDILDWLAESFSVESLPIDISDFPGIVSVGSPIAKFIGYRFYPDKIEGEGFFIAVLRKTDGTDTGASPPKKKTLRITANELSMIQPWLTEGIERSFFKQQDDILALPASFENDLVHLQQALYIRKAGLVIGKTTVKDLVPDHQLAMSSWVAEKINSIELPYTQAIQYLRKDEVHIEGAVPGWNLVKFNGHNLGWAKILVNRTNNYYPKEWRILKKI